MITLRITPLQLSTFHDSVGELEDRFANYLAELSGPWRMISVTRRFSFDPLRADLNRKAAALEPQAGTPGGWRYRWLKHYRRMYDDWERIEPPLAVDHYLLYTPAEPIAPEVLADSITK